MSFRTTLSCDGPGCERETHITTGADPRTTSSHTPGSWIHTEQTGSGQRHRFFCSWVCVSALAQSIIDQGLKY